MVMDGDGYGLMINDSNTHFQGRRQPQSFKDGEDSVRYRFWLVIASKNVSRKRMFAVVVLKMGEIIWLDAFIMKTPGCHYNEDAFIMKTPRRLHYKDT